MKGRDSRPSPGIVGRRLSRRQLLRHAGGALGGAALIAGGAAWLPGTARRALILQAQAAEMALRADDFVETIGVCTHLRYTNTAYADYSSIVKPQLLAAGIRYIRDGFEPSDTTYLDEVSDLYGSGIRAELVMQPPDVTPDQAVSMVEGLNGAVVAVEGANEPDNQPFTWDGYTIDASTGDFQAAISYQQDLYNAMKGSGSTSGVDVLAFSLGNPFAYAQDVGDISQWLDYGNLHSYAGGQEPTDSTNSLADYVQAETTISASQPLIASETGYFTAPATDTWQSGISQEAQGKYIPRLYLEYFNAGIVRTHVYELLDEGSDPTQSELNYGLLLADGSAKPAFTAVQNMIAILQEPGANQFTPASLDYSLSGDLTNVTHTLLQKQTGEFYLILWMAVSSYDTSTDTDIESSTAVTVQLNQSFSGASLYDPLTSSSPIATYSQPTQVAVTVPDHAVILELQP